MWQLLWGKAVVGVMAGLALVGCAPVVLGGAATAGVMAAQERGFQAGVKDTQLRAAILANLAGEKDLFLNVGVMVWDRAVVLTGVVPDRQAQARAVEIAQQSPGVGVVTNEILVGDYGPQDYAKDAWISGRIRAEMVAAADIDSINYNLETVLGQVYIQGVARTEAERYRVLYLVRSISGVLGVHPFIQVAPPVVPAQR